MTGYDWFIVLFAIPVSIVGFIALIALWVVVIRDVLGR